MIFAQNKKTYQSFKDKTALIMTVSVLALFSQPVIAQGLGEIINDISSDDSIADTLESTVSEITSGGEDPSGSVENVISEITSGGEAPSVSVESVISEITNGGDGSSISVGNVEVGIGQEDTTSESESSTISVGGVEVVVRCP